MFKLNTSLIYGWLFPILFLLICSSRFSYPVFSIGGRYTPEPFIFFLLLPLLSYTRDLSFLLKKLKRFAPCAFLILSIVLLLFSLLYRPLVECYPEFRTSMAILFSYLVVRLYLLKYPTYLSNFFLIYVTGIAILTPLSVLIFPNYSGLISDQSIRLYVPFISFFSAGFYFSTQSRIYPLLFVTLLSAFSFFTTTYRSCIVSTLFLLLLLLLELIFSLSALRLRFRTSFQLKYRSLLRIISILLAIHKTLYRKIAFEFLSLLP